MRTLFKLVVLAALVYGGWYVWKNYEVVKWFNNCRAQTNECFKLPTKKGAEVQKRPAFYIKDCQFSPSELAVAKDTRVTWYNEDQIERQVIGDNFDSSLIPKDRSYSKTFNQTGVFDFFCADQPNNKGKLIVR